MVSPSPVSLLRIPRGLFVTKQLLSDRAGSQLIFAEAGPLTVIFSVPRAHQSFPCPPPPPLTSHSSWSTSISLCPLTQWHHGCGGGHQPPPLRPTSRFHTFCGLVTNAAESSFDTGAPFPGTPRRRCEPSECLMPVRLSVMVTVWLRRDCCIDSA